MQTAENIAIRTGNSLVSSLPAPLLSLPSLLAALLALLFLSGMAHSVICGPCYQSFISLKVSSSSPTQGNSAVVASAHATYYDPTIVQSGKGTSSDKPEGQTNVEFGMADATNSSIVFSFEGYPLVDKNNVVICAPINTAGASSPEPGTAVCVAEYYRDPFTLSPNPIWNYTRCGMLTAELVRSYDQSEVKPSSQGAMVCPVGANSLASFSSLASVLSQNSSFYLACFPMFLLLGVLIASMYYSGRNPLSLFDITTPRLPAGKKVRMPRTNVPYGLAHKPRINDRLITRSEKAILAQLTRLYARGGQRATLTDMQRDVKKLFKNETDAKKIRARLLALAEKSGMSGNQLLAAKRAIERVSDIREAAAADKAIFGFARAGGPIRANSPNPLAKKYGRNWPGSILNKYAGKLGKPWKFVPGVEGKAWADKLPGLPYVERLTLVGANWFGSRYGNIKMRQDFRKAIRAEAGAALGLIKRDSQFADKWGFDSKRMGNIPRILERMHQETFHLGRAIQEESLRKVIEQITLSRKIVDDGKGNTTTSIAMNEKRMKEVLLIVDRLNKERNRASALNKDYAYHERLMLELLKLAKKHGMLDYTVKSDGSIVVDKNRAFSAITGDPNSNSAQWTQRVMKKEELEYLLNLVRKSERIMNEAARISDGTLAKDGRNPIFEKDGKSVQLDPEKTYNRYTEMFSLLEPDRTRWRDGRIPIIMLAHDLAEFAGRILRRTDYNFAKSEDESYKLARVRMRMEEEIALRNLYKEIMDQRALRDDSGILKTGWRKELAKIADPSSLREVGRFSYSERGEFAARHYITGYSSITYAYAAETERHKIEILRQMIANTYDKSWENLFRNYDQNFKRNTEIYTSMRNVHSIFTGKDEWNWDTYATWLNRGVTYKDMKQGVWIIGPNYVRPLAGLNMEEYRRTGKFKYDMARVAEVIGSPYSERMINASILTRQANGEWGRGAPMKDPDVRRLIYKYTNDQHELIQAMPVEGGLSASVEGRQKRNVLEANIRSLGERMQDLVRIRSRSEYGQEGNVFNRASQSFAQFLERTFGAATYNSNMRFNQWYASQTYMRVVLDSFSSLGETDVPTWEKANRKGTWKEYLSEEIQESFEAKRALAALRKEQLALFSIERPNSEQNSRISQIRSEIAALQSRIPELERRAREADKNMGGSDRALRSLADMSVPYYNINEHTVMRDPRIAPGGGYGIRQAIMTSYQSGQYMGERPGIWAGMNLVPGDRLLAHLARPSYGLALSFASFNRTFFTKTMGYTTVYNMDPERGPEFERYQMRQGVQSIFRPAESFDWFTRLMSKPIWRGKGSWKDEFGTTLREDQSWSGAKFLAPFTMRTPGNMVDEATRSDVSRYKLMGIDDLGKVARQNKLGLNFRDEYKLWEQKIYKEDPHAAVRALQSQLASATSREERRMIEYQLANSSDAANAQRAIWKIPGVGRFFQSGYYAIENRAGYDISAQGGSHRPWELFSAYHKNMAPPSVPGMVGKTWEGELTMFPRVASMMIEAPQAYDPKRTFSSDMPVWQNAQIDKAGNLRKLLRLGGTSEMRATGSANEGYVEGTTGVNAIYKEALKDPYRVDRYESNMLYHFMTLEEERMGYSVLNSPFVMPLSPPLFGLYHLMKKLPFQGNPVREWGMTSDNIYDKKLTPFEAEEQERTRRERMELARQNAAPGSQVFWTCPSHNISMRYGEICPLCHNKEEDIQNSQKKITALKRIGYGMADTVKSFAYSAIPFHGYNYYMNQAHCPTHGIAFARGSECPMCKDKNLLEARQLQTCPIHNVKFEKGRTCWKCSSRDPTDYERIGDLRPKYHGSHGTDAYKEEIRKQMNRIKNIEDDNKTTFM